MNEEIARAREEYLDKHPLDIHKHAFPDYDDEMNLTGMVTLPDMAELTLIASKYGFEYLASVRTDDDVDEWFGNILSTTKDLEVAGILLAQVFRNLAPFMTHLLDDDLGLQDTLKRIAVESWAKEFK